MRKFVFDESTKDVPQLNDVERSFRYTPMLYGDVANAEARSDGFFGLFMVMTTVNLVASSVSS